MNFIQAMKAIVTVVLLMFGGIWPLVTYDATPEDQNLIILIDAHVHQLILGHKSISSRPPFSSKPMLIHMLYNNKISI